MKEQKEHLGKGKRMSEKEQEMTSKKLGIHVGDSFQDTREIREVLDKSVFREEEPMHGRRLYLSLSLNRSWRKLQSQNKNKP